MEPMMRQALIPRLEARPEGIKRRLEEKVEASGGGEGVT
jgi:hypothetical protein